MKREYIVTLKKHEDLVSFYKDMEEFGGPKHVPNREVELKDRRAISRNTHYYLSDEEAKELEKDDRVLAVELTPEERGIEIVIRGSYSVSGDFDKNPDSAGDLNHLNWGLLHCAGSQSQRRRGTFGIGQTEQVTDSVTVFNDGENVDVVIVDEPVAYDHQEFLDPDTGQTRFVQYQWFNELDQYMVDLDTVEPDSDWSNFISSNGDSNGEIKYYNCQELDSLDLNHGTHVAGTATGKTQGWARKSNIYSMNVLGSSDTGSISSSDIISPYKVFDYLRAFHKNKDINPNTGRRNLTVTNHSWGYSPFEFLLTDLSQITSVYFRGVSYTNNGTWTESYIESTFGIRIFHIQISGQWYKLLLIPQQVAGLNADVEDAIKDGVVVITSAGNDYSYGVPQGHQDYNNIIYFSTDTENPVIIINDENYSSAALYFNRGGSPDSTEGVINVGSISEYSDFRRSPFSNYGPLIDIFAPGSNIISSIPGTNTSSYGVLSGTSMAGPQVAGIIACISTDKLEMNNEKALQHIKEIGIDDEMADTVNGGGFDDITTLRGAPNISVACKNRRDDQSILSFNDLPRSESGVLYPRKLSGKKLEFSTYNLSYTLQKDSVNVTQIQENESFSLTLFSSNAPDGTKVYYTIKQESTDVSLSNFKIDGAVPSSQGHFEINSGSSETKVFSFPQNINDAIDKGFEISLYLESERTTQYALIPKCSIKNITENYNISVNNLSNNQQDPSEMNEGQTLRFSITETTGLANENDLVDFEIYGLDGSQVSAVSSNNNSSLITFDVDGRKWTGQFKLNSQKSDFIDIVTLDDDLVLSDSANIPVYLKLVNTTRGNSTSNAFIKSNLTSVSPDYEDTTIEKYDLSSSNSVKENGATVTFNITSNVRDERSVNFSIIENTSSGYSANNIASVSGDTGTIVTWDSGTKTGTFIPDGVTGSCDINVTMKTDDIIWDGNYFTFRIDESGSQFTKDGGSQQFLNYIEKQVTIVEQSAVNFTVSYNSSETGYSEGDTLNFNFTSDKFVVSAKDLSYSIDITDSTYGEIATGDFSPGLSGTFKNDSQFTLTITDDLIIENAEYLKITFSDLSNSDTEFSPNDIVIKINQNDQNEIPLSGASISDAYYEYGPSEVANQFSTRTSLDEDDYIVFKIDTKNIGDGRWLDYNISCDGDNFSIDDIDSRWWKNSPYVARSYYSIKSENHISYSDNIQPDSDPATGKIKPLENGIAYLFIDFSFGTDTEINDKTLTLTITDPVSNQSISSNPITLFDISPESFTVTTLKNGESFNHLTENLSEGDTLTVNITPSVNWINSSRGIKYTLSGISANNLYTDTSLENSDIDPSSTPQNLQIDSEGKFSFDLNIVQDSSIENLENFTITLSDNYGSSFNKNEIDVEKIEINVDSSDTSETPNYTITSDKEVISEKSGVVTFTISSNVGDTRYVDYDVVTSSGISSISGISGTTVDSFNQKIRMKNDGSAIISITLDGSTDSSLLNESLTFKLLDSPAGNVLSEKTIVISDANPLQYTTSAKYYYGVDSAGAIGNTVNLNQVVSLYEPSVGNLSDSTSIQNSTFDSDISGWTTAVEYSTNSANVTHSDEHNGTMVFGSHQGEWSYAETPITHTNSGNQTNRIRINIPHITNNNSRFYVSILKDDNIIQNSGWINLNGINGTETTYSSINANGDGSYSGYVEVDYIDDVDLNSTYKLKIFHDQIKFSLTWAELYVGDIQIYDRDNSRIIFDFEVQNPESADLTALSRQITATITYDYDSTSVTGQSDISFNSSFEILNDSSMSSTEMKGQFILDINDDRFIENVEYFKITFVDNLNGSSTFSSNDIVIKINQNDQNEIPLSGASISDAYYQFYRSGSGTYSVSTRTSLDEDDYIVFKIDTKNIGDGRWLDYNISCDGDNSFTVDSRWWKNSPYVDIGYYSIESANHISYSDNIQPDSDPATGKIKPLEDGFAYLFIDLSSGTDTEINDKTLTLTITDPVSNQSISSNPITLFDTSPESFAVTTLKNGASFNHLTENLSEGDTLSVVVSPSNNWTNSSRGIKYTINKDSITDADITPHTSPVNLNLDSGNTFSFTINVTDDLLIENNEVFEIVLSDNYGSTFDKNNMNITVLASDTSETPNYTITSNTTTLQENGGTVDFTVTSNAGDERELDFEIIENGTSDNIKQISGLSSTTVSYNKSSRTGKVKIKEDGTCNFRITSKTDNFIWNTDNYFKIKFLETSSIFNTSDIKIDSISVNDSRSFPDSALDGYPQDLEINVEGVLSPDGYEAVLTPVLDSYGQLTNIIISNPGKYKTITSVELYSPSETLSQVILDSNGDPLLDSGNQPISIISYDTSNFQGVSSVETGVTVTNDVSPLTYSIYPYISDSEGNYDISSNNLTEASSMMFSVVPFVNEGFSRDIFYKIDKLTTTNDFNYETAKIDVSVDENGTVTSITIVEGGFGYTSDNVGLEEIFGIGNGNFTVNLTNSSITSITIVDGGTGHLPRTNTDVYHKFNLTHSGYNLMVSTVDDTFVEPDEEFKIYFKDLSSSDNPSRSSFVINGLSNLFFGESSTTINSLNSTVPEYTISSNVNTVDEDGGVVVFDISSNVRRDGQSIGFQITEDSATDNIESVSQAFFVDNFESDISGWNTYVEPSSSSLTHSTSHGGTMLFRNLHTDYATAQTTITHTNSGTQTNRIRINIPHISNNNSKMYVYVFKDGVVFKNTGWFNLPDTTSSNLGVITAKGDGTYSGYVEVDYTDDVDLNSTYEIRIGVDQINYSGTSVYTYVGDVNIYNVTQGNLGKSGTITPSAVDGSSKLFVTMKTDSVVYDGNIFDITFSETGSEFELDTDSGISISNSITKTISMNDFSPIDYKVTSDVIQTTEGGSAINVTIEATNLSDIINVSRTLNLSTDNPKVSIPSTVDITTISAGEHSGSFTITPLEDILIYPDEVNITITDPRSSSSTFLVNPDSENEAPVVGTGTLTVTVIDNDIPEYTITPNVNTVDEDGGVVAFDISSNVRRGGQSIGFQITEDSATDNIESVYQSLQIQPYSRYRILMTRSHNTVYTRLDLREVELINVYSQNVLREGGYLSSVYYSSRGSGSSGTPQDGNVDLTHHNDYSYYPGDSSGTHWCEWRLNSQIYIKTFRNYGLTYMKDWKFQGSNDGNTWEDILDFTDYPYKTNDDGWDEIYIFGGENLGKSGTITPSAIDGFSRLAVTMKTDSVVSDAGFDITFSETGSEFKLDTDSGISISNSITKTININEFSPVDYKVTSDAIQTTEGSSAINVTIEATNLSDIINVSRALNLSTNHGGVSIPSTVDITTISAGEHSGSFTITPLEDSLVYPDEVNITITDPQHSSSTFLVNPDSENEVPVVGTGTLTVTVIDNDIPEYTISSDVNTVDEDGGIVVFDISSNARGTSLPFEITEDSATDNIESVYQTYLFDDFASDISGWTTESYYANVTHSTLYDGTMNFSSQFEYWAYAEKPINHTISGTQTNRIRINIPHITNNVSQMYVQILKDGVSLYSTGYQYLRDTISSDYGVITANGDGSYSGYLEIDLTYDVDLNSEYKLRIGHQGAGWNNTWKSTYVGDVNIYSVTQGNLGKSGTITLSEIDGSSKLVVKMKTDSASTPGNTFDITFSESGSEFKLDTDSGFTSDSVTKTININEQG